jgi:lipoprotein signal peptidase
MTWTRKARYFWPVTLVVLLTDCATKRVAEETLAPAHLPHAVLGDLVRFTLAYNPGGAMSLSFGSYSGVRAKCNCSRTDVCCPDAPSPSR